MTQGLFWWGSVLCAVSLSASAAFAQSRTVTGSVHDETGGALPGVSVELRGEASTRLTAVTDGEGVYHFNGVAPGHYRLTFTLIDFAMSTRDVDLTSAAVPRVDSVLHLALNPHYS